MKKYVIFYCVDSYYDKVIVNAESLKDAFATAEAFGCKTGAVILGICSEFWLNTCCHG